MSDVTCTPADDCSDCGTCGAQCLPDPTDTSGNKKVCSFASGFTDKCTDNTQSCRQIPTNSTDTSKAYECQAIAPASCGTLAVPKGSDYTPQECPGKCMRSGLAVKFPMYQQSQETGHVNVANYDFKSVNVTQSFVDIIQHDDRTQPDAVKNAISTDFKITQYSFGGVDFVDINGNVDALQKACGSKATRAKSESCVLRLDDLSCEAELCKAEQC